jgi:hypothetical protein
MRTCEECQEPIEGTRRKRHPECKRLAHARAEKARREAVKERLSDSWSPESTAVGRDMIARDFTIPGSASKPPSFSGVPEKPKAARLDPDVVHDPRVPHPNDREQKHSMDGMPNAIRRDRVRLELEWRRQQMAEENETVSWDELKNAPQADGHTVEFNRPASVPQNTRPRRMVNALGQSIPRARWS